MELKRPSTLSRRDFLQAALGAAVALKACRRPERTPRFGGSLLGQSADVGHLLRESLDKPVTRRTEQAVVIVGAGPAGLSAAWRLVRAGETRFTLLDLEPEPGGTSASTAHHPWGAHYVPVPSVENRSLVRLLNELGAIERVTDEGEVVGAEDVLCRQAQERLFFRGQWHEGLYPRSGALPSDLVELERFEARMRAWALSRDAHGRPFFALPSHRCSMEEEALRLDRISMGEYLRANGWTSERLRWWVDYACRDDYGLGIDETSAWAGIFYFAARMENPHHEASAFLSWPEGNGRLVRHLSESARGHVRTHALVVGLTPRDTHVDVRLYDARTKEVEVIEAREVIAAVPPFVLRRLLPSPEGLMPSEPWGSWVVANLRLGDRPASKGFPLAWDNVLYDSRSLGYVVSTHQAGIDDGPTDFTWYLPLTGGDPKREREALLQAPWERWVEAVLADLNPAHVELERHVERIDIWRWGHAMPRPVPGFLYEGKRREFGAPVGRIHPAHCGTSGLALFEESHDQGVRAAERVLGRLGVGFETFL